MNKWAGHKKGNSDKGVEHSLSLRNGSELWKGRAGVMTGEFHIGDSKGASWGKFHEHCPSVAAVGEDARSSKSSPKKKKEVKTVGEVKSNTNNLFGGKRDFNQNREVGRLKSFNSNQGGEDADRDSSINRSTSKWGGKGDIGHIPREPS